MSFFNNKTGPSDNELRVLDEHDLEILIGENADSISRTAGKGLRIEQIANISQGQYLGTLVFATKQDRATTNYVDKLGFNNKTHFWVYIPFNPAETILYSEQFVANGSQAIEQINEGHYLGLMDFIEVMGWSFKGNPDHSKIVAQLLKRLVYQNTSDKPQQFKNLREQYEVGKYKTTLLQIIKFLITIGNK
ncbi:MAG: hypothetical protein UT34_C0002G0018 [candidate division WS6 bacterium GW2011_GWF2_39_15]|uniref:Uncharacterized protein n=1 Tax=candidate division WS6 bacterium GW2011_GWF2_39_15 TaxID=1619100 RepID=A0A0G0MY90_9BACT|nr:MAG: hypothetical protein UT34_C0002G0018 [candidate division WS6 bacterium GW2011_GWF2_39_15]